jgi:FkbM family methyltransferase
MTVQITVRSPGNREVRYEVREDTNDAALIIGILGSDEYQLAGMGELSGWALDIGAHVGTVGLALAIDNPGLSVVCVEPVPGNADLIRHSIQMNNLADRVFMEEASAAALGTSTVPCHFDYTSHTIPDQGYVIQNRFIGNLWREGGEGTVIDAPAVSLKSLADKYGADEWRLVKTDCEGCEWQVFTTDASLCAEIIGEWHDGPFSRIETLLKKTHKTTLLTDYGGSGIFRAVRK